MQRRDLLRSVLAAGTLTASGLPLARAQGAAWPQRPIKLVVPYPAGSSPDVVARLLAGQMEKALGQPIVIDNRAGAAGMIAAEAISRAAPDGYNLLTADIAILAFNPAVYSPIRYDAQNSFAAVGLMARFPMLIAASPQSGIKNMADLLAEIKKGGLGYGTAGVGTPHHIAMEQLLNTSQLQAEHIPYRGDAPALQDLAGGQIKVAALAPSLSLPFVSEGKLVPLAVTSEKRLPQLPQVPTLLELHLAQQPVYAWQGLVVPAGTPAERIGKLSQELQQSLKNPEVVRKLEDLGMEPISSTPEAMAAYVRKEQALWGPFIKARGISNK